jgi:clan AA aspartic protease
MGITYASLRLANRARPDLEEIEVEALVDTGALHLRLPEHVALQLQLDEDDRREVRTADGKRLVVPYVSPVRISMLNHSCVTGALVMGDQVIPGAIPMKDMDLIIEPARLRVTVNPASPNIPASIACSHAAPTVRSA